DTQEELRGPGRSRFPSPGGKVRGEGDSSSLPPLSGERAGVRGFLPPLSPRGRGVGGEGEALRAARATPSPPSPLPRGERGEKGNPLTPIPSPPRGEGRKTPPPTS